MFSELKHHPRYETVFQQTDPVPAFIDRQWSDRTQETFFKFQERTTFRVFILGPNRENNISKKMWLARIDTNTLDDQLFPMLKHQSTSF